MKRIKKIVGLVLSLCLTFGAFSSVVSFAAEEVGAKKAYEKNMESAQMARHFKEEFLFITVSRRTQSSELVYPDNFGGIYIDDNNELHITYTENKETLMNKVAENEAHFDQVDFSYNHLKEVYEYVSSSMAENTSITEVYIDETQNKVVVAMDASFRNNWLEKFSENFVNFDERVICFSEPTTAVTTIAGGSSVNGVTGICTAGYNARDYDGNYGFVTCGHGFTGLWESAYDLNGNLLGTVTHRNFIGYTSVDAAFVEYENQNEKTNQFLGGGIFVEVISADSLSIGEMVCKYGNSSGYQSGTISSIEASVTFRHEYDDTTRVLLDQIRLNIRQISGDSGSPLVIQAIGPVLDANMRPNSLIGIVTIGQGESFGWASKIENINSRFDLTTYIVV